MFVMNGYLIAPEEDLQEASLVNADLRQADLQNADLSDSDLERANLEGANLESCNLEGANLINASLNGANIHNVDDLLTFNYGNLFGFAHKSSYYHKYNKTRIYIKIGSVGFFADKRINDTQIRDLYNFNKKELKACVAFSKMALEIL